MKSMKSFRQFITEVMTTGGGPSLPGPVGPGDMGRPTKPVVPENMPPGQIPDDYEFPPGTYQWDTPEGPQFTLPGGTVILPDGRIYYPDGTIISPDGRRTPPGKQHWTPWR